MIANLLLKFANIQIPAQSKEGTPTKPFKLPIQYLDSSDVFQLNDTVATDLELLVVSPEETETCASATMYDHVFQPSTEFAKRIIPQWRTSFTTNVKFLKETQETIQSMEDYKIKIYKYLKNPEYTPNYNTLMQIWQDTKEDGNFLERYSYMEIEMLKGFNKMPSFLQAISIVNMGSPILSFLIPFVLFLMPFIILKIQGIPITFSIYLSVLQEISRNHFIGKMLSNVHNMSLQNFIYLMMLVGLYAYQIYQNYIACIRFYNNIRRINQQICEMQEYLNYSILSMESFCKIIENKSQYKVFQTDVLFHLDHLYSLRNHIASVQPFEPSFSKIGEIGFLLGCYYELYSNEDYAASLQYSFYFEGFINNMLGIHENLRTHKMGIATYYEDVDKDVEVDADKDVDVDKKCEGDENNTTALVIKKQYYPALMNGDYIVNDADVSENMIITGPNASGKTTFLKTTVLNIIFSQQFGCGFYSECTMKPYTNIHSYLNIPDTSGRDSLFQAESRRCKEIIDEIADTENKRRRHFCIFDELYSGTNPLEASKSAYSFLLYLSKHENVNFILTTHYVDICNKLTESSHTIKNWKMDVDENKGDLSYRYTISNGISEIQGAVKVLRDMKYPEEIIQTILDYDVSVVEDADKSTDETTDETEEADEEADEETAEEPADESTYEHEEETTDTTS